MDNTLTIAVLAGTTREQRRSIKAAHYVADYGRGLPGIEIIFVDPKDFHFEGDGNDPEGKDPRYTEIVQKADAFFVVMPEYNHSIPGSLKRMMDSELEAYKHKPVAIAGVSKSSWGGVRGVEALVTSVRQMGLVATSYSMYFPRVQDLFNEQGELLPEYRELYDANAKRAYDELLWMARALRHARLADQANS